MDTPKQRRASARVKRARQVSRVTNSEGDDGDAGLRPRPEKLPRRAQKRRRRAASASGGPAHSPTAARRATASRGSGIPQGTAPFAQKLLKLVRYGRAVRWSASGSRIHLHITRLEDDLRCLHLFNSTAPSSLFRQLSFYSFRAIPLSERAETDPVFSETVTSALRVYTHADFHRDKPWRLPRIVRRTSTKSGSVGRLRQRVARLEKETERLRAERDAALEDKAVLLRHQQRVGISAVQLTAMAAERDSAVAAAQKLRATLRTQAIQFGARCLEHGSPFSTKSSTLPVDWGRLRALIPDGLMPDGLMPDD